MQTPRNDDDQRRLLLAVVLSGVVLLMWSVLFPSPPIESPPPQKAEPGQTAQGDTPAPKAGEAAVDPATGAALTWS